MSDQYTPTTDDVRLEYMAVRWGKNDTVSFEARAEFDRWLAERDRQMLERGYDEGKSAEELAWMHCFDGHPVPEGGVCDECRTDNSYRKERDDDCY